MRLSSDDELAILRLLNAYAQTGSRQDVDSWTSLFIEDGVWERKQAARTGKYTDRVLVRGKAALRDFAIKSFAMQGDLTYQYISANAVIDGDGDQARAVSTAFIFGIDSGGVTVVLIGNFEDRFERTSDGWKFAYRGMSVST
jgi:hypothetical protein